MEDFSFPKDVDKVVPIFVWRDKKQFSFFLLNLVLTMFAVFIGWKFAFFAWALYFLVYKVILVDSRSGGLMHLLWSLNFPSLGVISKYGLPINMDYFK